MRLIGSLLITAVLAAPALAGSQPGETIQLFNGENLEGWYVFTVETGYQNPGVFQVRDGKLYVPGGEDDHAFWGGLITRKEYENYRLVFEYKWGDKTYGRRKGRARDSGICVHCIGPNGPGPWMDSYETQVIEGGTGDIILIHRHGKDRKDRPYDLKLTAEAEKRDKGTYYKPGASTIEMVNGGRLNWWGRDPEWEDVKGFRGAKDITNPPGEWNRVEVICKGDTVTNIVNGEVATKATKLNNTRGKIFIQTEGAEVWYRNIELTPLEGFGSGLPAEE